MALLREPDDQRDAADRRGDRQPDDEQDDQRGRDDDRAHASWWSPAVAVRHQNARVHHVLFEHEVEEVADDRDLSDDDVDQDVDDHPSDLSHRHAVTQRCDDDQGRHDAADHVADAGNQADGGIEADPFPRSRNRDCFIEQIREPPQRDEIARKLLVRLDDFGDMNHHARQYARNMEHRLQPVSRKKDGAPASGGLCALQTQKMEHKKDGAADSAGLSQERWSTGFRRSLRASDTKDGAQERWSSGFSRSLKRAETKDGAQERWSTG